MRARRWLVVGAAATATVAAVTATVVHEVTGHKPAAKPTRITIAPLGQRAAGGVIATGTVNGQRWQIRLTKTGGQGCWAPPHSGWAPASDCVESVGHNLARWAAYAGPAWLWTFSPAVFGPVKPDVALVTMRLTDGAVLNLRPVEAFGRRWIGVVLPDGLVPAQAVAYSRQQAIAHSVPYTGEAASGPDFLSWLPPADRGPKRVTKVIRGGGWTMVLHAGPWVNVLVDGSGGFLLALGDRPSGVLEGSCGLPRTLPMAFPRPAAYIQLVMSDGSSRRIPLVTGAGEGFAIIRATSKPAILTWAVRDSRGRRLTGGTGPPASC